MLLSWDAFFERYRPLARALAHQLGGSGSEPDDVVQDASLALLAAWRRDRQRFESSAHVRNYFLRTVRNLAVKTRSTPHRLRPLDEEPRARDRSEPGASIVRERQETLALLLRDLEPADRELIARRFLRRETLVQVSLDTGVAVSTLHSREKSLLARLRQRLELELEDTA